MEIVKFKTSDNFRYLWLKYVTGVNLKDHCAKSLLGNYSKRITSATKELENVALDEFEGRFVYLCGVSIPYVWSNNLHLALRHKKGSVVKFQFRNTYIEIKDAEQIEITQKPFYEGETRKVYTTCRNWQFANMIKDEVD